MSITAWTRTPAALVDLVTATAVVGSTAVTSGGARPGPSWLAVLALCALLPWRGRRPVLVATASMLGCGLYYPFSTLDGPVILVLVVALYSVAAVGRLVAAGVIGAVGAAGAWIGETLSTSHPLGDVGVFLLTGWLVAVVALGAARFERAQRLRVEADRARQEALEQRLRLAREVHDLVGHSLSVITVQASAALHRLDDDPAAARPALTVVKATGKEALGELRHLVQALRPPVGLHRLDDLVALAPLAPTGGERPRVRLVRKGSPSALPADVDLAAYRVVQEALTNVHRHARRVREVTVSVEHDAGRLLVRVEDDGTGADDGARARFGGDAPTGPGPTGPGPTGVGLTGLADRVSVLGGDFRAGPGPAGTGFRVEASFPASVPAAVPAAS